MLSLLRRLTTFAAVTAAALAIAPKMTSAAQFEQQNVDPSRFITIAAPARNGQLHNLLILEQVSNQRPCWQESGNAPVQVDPLLLNFDFTGICNRLSDSNGYSVRVAGQDLGLAYRLEVLNQDNDLVLRATPIRDRAVYPPIEIGRAHGTTTGFAKLELDRGWRLTRRIYNGQALGHIYLTHDDALNMPIATASGPLSRPGSSLPLNPGTGATPGGSTGTGSSLPPIPPQATNPIPLPPPSTNPGSSDTYYRVIVPFTSLNTLQQVQAIEPGAFRTTVDGRSVIQVGLFREQAKAVQAQQELAQVNLSAQILTASAPVIATPSPTIPSIPRGQVVVVIDAGHGGGDPGAIGIGGIQEKALTLAMAQRVQQRLQQAGITALMTRPGDQDIDLDPRVNFAERANATVFVSIHCNSINLSRPDVNGLETYYYASAASQQLAQTIHSSILRRTDMLDRGVRTARFYVIRYTTMPAVLVETGFVTGADDAARFNDASRRDQIADAIAEGVLTYLRQ